MTTKERHSRILARVQEEGAVTVADLVAELGASEATLRRDLAELDAQGLLRRVHGGARRAELRGLEEPFAARSGANPEGKRRIARAIAALLAPGEAVVLDSGTTTLEVARAVRELPLRVVPLSLAALDVLAEGERVRVTVPGGELRPGERSFVGPLAERSLAALRFDTAIISPCALDIAGGATAYDTEDAAVKQAAMRSAERRILVCDATKWGRSAFAAIADLSSFDVLVTDRDVTPDESAMLEEKRVEVVVA
ncbi:DeoR/GlpR family DNA-binding transcription regulator [Microbacterium sp. JZ31]|uniref:DeoR/GlpR family DNA-binding transcription regulator n=1 Tax=Microbacterium sp. JZ31 TaxID=1906274 RepID=UPI0019314428|nr:DeoR/GlpR family DNA-binding transcription regulator [Microbacterium sp. JZ31]